MAETQNDPLLPGYSFNAHLVAGLTPIEANGYLDFFIDRPLGMKGYILNLTIRGVLADTEQAASHMDGVRHQVRNSVARAELAATSLREIRDRVGAVLDKTRDVARAAQEQSLASNSIAGNVEQIAQRVDESNAAVEQVSDQVMRLNVLAADLRTTAMRFTL